jgi:uncharacterized protein (DUF1800 family)
MPQTITGSCSIVIPDPTPPDVNALATAVAAILANAGAAPIPTVTLSISPPTVAVGGQITLTWTSAGATSCTGSGAWSGALATAGSQKSDPSMSGTYVYTLTANGPGGSVSTSATLNVSSTDAPPPATLGTLGAAVLLNQATFGATLDSIAATAPLTALQWIQGQMALPITGFTATANNAASVKNGVTGLVDCPFYVMAVQAPDQLRQRVAFMLSELFVTSFSPDESENQAQGLLYDIFLNGAFGNFEPLLYNVSTSLAMGIFLNAFRNSAALNANQHADENYAREIQQLFTVGLNLLNQDGSLQLDASGNPIPTYTQAEITQMAKVFTGWGSSPGVHSGDQAYMYDTTTSLPMAPYEDYHDHTAKTIIGGVVLPAGQTALQDMQQTIHTLAQHPNVAPFLGKQFIQKLVTSNPSPGYISRVAAVWANDGTGVRGNLGAVITAILTDAEASQTGNTHGKLREPLIMLAHLWRVFKAVDANGQNYSLTVTQQVQTLFGQTPMRARTVFNSFTPFYTPEGPVENAGLVGPEFQMLNENTVAGAAQMWSARCAQWKNAAGAVSGSGTVFLNTSQWESFASNPANLVSQLNTVFCAGSLSTAAQAALTTYAKTLPVASPWLVATQTAQALMTSPQYAIQR